jgi:hypothetical protein
MKLFRLFAITTSLILLGLVLCAEVSSFALKSALIITLSGTAVFWYYQKDLR